jgi:hypothetical protein
LSFEYGIEDQLSLGLSKAVRSFQGYGYLQSNYSSTLPYGLGITAAVLWQTRSLLQWAFPRVPSSGTVTVSHWGGTLQKGAWVQVGERDLLNWLKTGLWSRGRAAYSVRSGVTYQVAAEDLAPPTPENIPGLMGKFAQWYKWVTGQRIYTGPIH